MSSSIAPLRRLHHIHHAAYRCRDAEQTRWFYEDVLGFPLAAAMVFDEEPGSQRRVEYMHLFFQMGDGNFIAFFDVPDDVSEKQFLPKHGFDLHLAFEVDSMETLKAWRRHFKACGRPSFGPIDHGFIHSLYLYDPNGIQVEITVRDARYDALLEEDGANARRILAEWTQRTRAKKVERCGEDMVDLRGIDFSRVDTSKVKFDIPAHSTPSQQE